MAAGDGSRRAQAPSKGDGRVLHDLLNQSTQQSTYTTQRTKAAHVAGHPCCSSHIGGGLRPTQHCHTVQHSRNPELDEPPVSPSLKSCRSQTD